MNWRRLGALELGFCLQSRSASVAASDYGTFWMEGRWRQERGGGLDHESGRSDVAPTRFAVPRRLYKHNAYVNAEGNPKCSSSGGRVNSSSGSSSSNRVNSSSSNNRYNLTRYLRKTPLALQYPSLPFSKVHLPLVFQ
jgi:hypothetical protein